ncbi:MAG: 4Fe-4S dicluster domain-containing protein [Candidatus Electryonea clarkiae]|nr:4Fe-4S dicluster domain-containing protein [Candidatus Electryonea clarkiae]MDP8286137.1 4Fe-4S dicluster domain-containing protein [Candidatus Electryonea clarkiae]
MPVILSDRTIDLDFIRKLEDISGQPLKTCMQCGTCAAVCPMDESTDMTPRKLIHLAQLGLHDAVMNSNMAWICASCHTCEVRCPRGIDIPKLMEALRLLILRKNENFIEPFEISDEAFEELPQIAMVSAFRKHTA